MRTLNCLFVLSVITTLIACDGSSFGKPGSGVKGVWELVRSTGGIGGVIIPAPLLLKKSVRIDDDYFEEYHGNTRVFKSGYRIVLSFDSTFGANKFFEFEDGTSYGYVQQRDELTLIELCHDCFVHEYRRN